MRTAADILNELRISTKSSAPGRYYTTCPKCSHSRKRSHQKLKCLGVTIDDRGLAAGCNHCGWTGGGYFDQRNTADQPNARGVARSPVDRSGARRGGYGALQRQARSNWR